MKANSNKTQPIINRVPPMGVMKPIFVKSKKGVSAFVAKT
jgi:hypothetical protein